MKTRMHRFWLSITLAAGSLASPLSARLAAHDLPWRWASDTVSSSDWNYLRDDCLDGRLLSRYGDSLSKAMESSLATCPTEEALAQRFDVALASRAANSFANEMACWASRWESLQQKAGDAARASLVTHRQGTFSRWAARPEFGVPPAPLAPVRDTCSFEPEYRAMQAAADLLAAEMARAAEMSARESQLTRALADAKAIEAAAIDAIAQGELASASERSFCGGQSREIVSQQRPHSDFAPPVDEYMAYDLDGRDAHWLGGLGKSWRLRAAVSASAAESFGADELLENAAVAHSPAAGPVEIIEAPDDNAFALCDFVEPMAPSSELEARNAVAARPAAGVAPAPSVPASAWKDRLAEGLEWLDGATCIVAAEMCGMDHAHRLGEQWGAWSLTAAQQTMTTYVAMGQYLNLPPTVYEPTPDLEPRSDVYVVYTDAQGNDTAIPGSLAQAWNAGQSDASLDEANYLSDELAAYQSGSGAQLPRESAPTASRATALVSGLDLAQLRRHVLSLAARELDALGMSCLQTADQLSNWADPQIASREDSDVR